MRKLYALLAGLFLCLVSTQAGTVAPDVANFTFTIDAPNNNVAFTNTSVLGNEPGDRKAFWSFGDGITQITPPLANTQHHYQVGGVYNVCLKIYRYRPNLGDSVLSAQICKTLEIPVVCGADFTTLNVASTPLLKYFIAQPSHNRNKKPVKVCWNFGDGRDTCILYSTSYTGQYGVSHHYNQPGNFNVCVNILYDGGCQAQKCHPLEIPGPDSCAAAFQRGPVTVNNPLQANFIALPWHSNNKKPAKICWEFGDGRDTCILYSNTYTGPYNVNHTYQEPGLYQVCVNILYQGGCQARKCEPVRIGRPDTCAADFERLPVSPVNNPLTVVYKALPQHNNNKKPQQICWQFGDGRDTCINYLNIYNGQYNVTHTYLHPGLYQVCVKIRYYGGCEAIKCKPVQVGRPDTCAADFERVQVAPTVNPLQAYFKALPQHNNNRKPARVCWQFGDGTDTCYNYPESYTGLYLAQHRYDHPGVYEVCVKIQYYGGCEARKCKPVVIIRPDSCGADFERLQPNAASLLTYFKALPQHNNNRKPARVCWQFGDGRDTCINYPETFTGPYAVAHMYNHPGLYNVCVNIRYYGGCEASKCKPVQIGRPDTCAADFERLPVTASSPLLEAFRALPQHNNNRKPARVCWEFGDGRDTCINYPENYTGQYVVTHRYNQPGQYNVCVKILYYGGCEARKCKPIVIPPPQQNCTVHLFEITPSITSLVRGFLAVPSSTPPSRPILICWYFGDGDDTCITIDPQQPLPDLFIRHTYPGPGQYRACVKVRFQSGCIAEDCKEVVIRASANICGGFMTDSLMGPRTFKFKGFSIHAPNDEVLLYRWTFGDGTSAIGREVVHTYTQPGGNFNVCLTITTRLGCETRICKTVRIPGNNQPALVITPNPVINTLNAAFFSTHTETVNVRILNSNGIVIRNYTRNVTVGPNTWTFDVSTLLPGMYSMVVQSPNQLASAIFMKQ